jgi:hypothetical protein
MSRPINQLSPNPPVGRHLQDEYMPNDAAKTIADVLHSLLLIVAILAFCAYIVLMFLVYVGPETWLVKLREAVQGKTLFNLGLPASAAGAYAVVALLLKLFPPEKQNGSLKLKAFGLEFTGPAGPITFWIACFLAIVVAVKAFL